MDDTDRPGKPGRLYSQEQKQALLAEFEAWAGSDTAFAALKGMSRCTLYKWRNALRAHGAQGLKPGFGRAARKAAPHRGPYTPEQRLRAVEAFRKSGMTREAFCKAWKVSELVLRNWLKRYEQGGGRALVDGNAGAKRGPKGLPQPVRESIIEVKREFPDFGLRRVRDFLMRFKGIRVSTGSVRKEVIREGLPPGQAPKAKPKSWKRPRLFERAVPGELWQSDITSMLLPRSSQRLYLAAFVDDHSRFVVSWILSTRQSQDIVMDALLEGISKYGKPREVLTDQGRQYVSWRGTSDFQRLLQKQGIRHVVSRTHHPETLGKCERFWETLQNEFWSRVNPAGLDEARARLAHFVAHFNFFRPHQGIGGLVPADRFFGAESAVRGAIEGSISKNELDLAVGEPPRQSVYLTGMIGDKPVALTGEGGKLVFHAPDGSTRELEYHQLGMPQGAPTTREEQHGNGTEGPGANEPGNVAGAGPNRPGTGRPEDAPQEGIRPAEIPGGSREVPLELGHGGGEAQGPQNGGPRPGTLDGQDDSRGAGEDAPDSPGGCLPALPHGPLGNGGGSAQAAQESAEGDAPLAGGGPQTAPETRGGPGTPERPADGPPAGGPGHADDARGDGGGSPGTEGEKKSGGQTFPQESGSSSGSSSGQFPSGGVSGEPSPGISASANEPSGIGSTPGQ